MAKKKYSKSELELKQLKHQYEWMDGEYDRMRDVKDDLSLRMREMLDDMAELSADIVKLEGAENHEKR